jgi:transposase
MNYNFKSYNPNQPYLLPPSLDNWLPQDHFARFISETVDQMDLSALITAYRTNAQGSAALSSVYDGKVAFIRILCRDTIQPEDCQGHDR